MENYIANKKNKGTSIIVCCYNSAVRLPKTLKHLSEIKHCNKALLELIIVDNNSTDNTAEVAVECWAELNSPFPITIINERSQGLAYARKAGVLASQYSIGIFCDDDNWLCSEYTDKVVKIFEDQSVGVIGGASTPISTIDFPAWFYTNCNSFAVGTQENYSGDITHRHYVWGAGMGFRVDFLKAIYSANIMPLAIGRKGDHLSSGDDSEICAWYIFGGYKIYYDESLKFEHFIPPQRLNNEYRERFLLQKYTSAADVYDAYLSVAYFKTFQGRNLTDFIKNLVRASRGIFSLIKSPRNLKKIWLIERAIRSMTFSRISGLK